jgi:glycosyltransferase involved in cell wall biosynthesis
VYGSFTLKILIVSDAWLPQINGVVRTYEHLKEELEKQNCEVNVIGPSSFKRRMAMPGYKEIELVLFPYKPLKRMVLNYQPDTVHIATEGPLGWAMRKICLRHNIPYTSAYHTQFPDYVEKRIQKIFPPLARTSKKLSQAFIKKFHQSAYAIMVATPSLEQELLGLGYTTPMHRLTRGVKLDMFRPGEKEVFDDLAHPIALYVGRIAVEKNLEDFLKMDWHGSKAIVGDGPDLEELKRKYPDVYFAGAKTGAELASHYRSADVFVFPSKTDTFGMVLIEALASGLPVAAYDVTGPKDIITTAALGAVDQKLSDAALKALEASENRGHRHEHVKSHYTWEKAATQFLDIQKLARTDRFGSIN